MAAFVLARRSNSHLGAPQHSSRPVYARQGPGVGPLGRTALAPVFSPLRLSIQVRYKVGTKAKNLYQRQQERKEFFQRELDKEKARRKPMNEQLAIYPQVVLIDHTGKNVGVKSYREAMSKARNEGLNLVEVVPGKVPLCRMLADEVKKKIVFRRQAFDITKEVRFRDVITDHDLQIKVEKIKELISKGNRVKLVLIFKKREDFDLTTAKELVGNVFTRVQEIAVTETELKLAGDRMAHMLIGPSKAVRQKVKREREDKIKEKALEKEKGRKRRSGQEEDGEEESEAPPVQKPTQPRPPVDRGAGATPRASAPHTAPTRRIESYTTPTKRFEPNAAPPRPAAPNATPTKRGPNTAPLTAGDAAAIAAGTTEAGKAATEVVQKANEGKLTAMQQLEAEFIADLKKSALSWSGMFKSNKPQKETEEEEEKAEKKKRASTPLRRKRK